MITVIIGPSGCGKTSFLKCLNRMVELYEDAKITGKIFINNEDILHSNDDVANIRKKMGLLAQRPYPLPMNIYNNVAYGLKISGRKNKAMLYKRVEHYLRIVGLWEEVKDRLKEPASRLSIGQQQRLCLARGLAVDPNIILADEPTSALDPLSSQIIEQKFIELKKNYTIIIVTHNLQQAKRIADYVLVMNQGEISEEGTASELFKTGLIQRMEKIFT
ncbi:MAG: ATP-binding cassette domain-containing protein [Bacteroidia bacterium]|nr:ATP-binding cassette domain-containing protein [Bacteroidia bacterium]